MTTTRAAYMRAYRTAKPEKQLHAARAAAARRKALSKLAKLHPQDMQLLLDAERAAAGLS